MFYVSINTTLTSVSYWVRDERAMYEKIFLHIFDEDIFSINVYDFYNDVSENIPYDLTTLIAKYHDALSVLPDNDKERMCFYMPRRRGGRRAYRHPKTQRARRMIEGSEVIDGVLVRGKQRKQPSSWDDIHASDGKHYSWKRHRQHQYR